MTAGIERVLDALGDRTRRAVFKRIRGGKRSVREIADGLDVSRPAVSQHLKILKDARLVVVRIEGTRRVYSADPHGIEELRKWLDGFWRETLVAFRRAAELEAAKETAGRRNDTFEPSLAGRRRSAPK